MERYAEINGERILLKKGELQRKSDGMLLYRYIDEDKQRQTLYATDIDELRKKERLLLSSKVKTNYTINELFNEWKISVPMRNAWRKFSAPTGITMNSWMSTLLSACSPPFKMFIIGTGNCFAFTPPIYW